MLDGRYTYEQQTMKVMRNIALLSPLFLTIYGLMIEYHIIESDTYLGIGVLIGIMTVWMVIGIVQYLFPAATKKRAFVYIILQHLLAMCYIVYISGFSMPFLSCWALLYLMSYIYFSYTGFFVSMVVLLVALTATIANDPSRFHDISDTITVIVVTALVGITTVLLNRIHEYDREEIARSKLDTDIQKERMLTLVNNLADAIVSTDHRGYIQIYNAAFANLIDTNLSVYNRSIDAILLLKDTENKAANMSDLLHDTALLKTTDEYWLEVGQERIRLEITYTPIRSTYSRSGGVRDNGYLLIIRDVTKSKSLEEERDEFISVVSHELRTPIAITEGSIDNARLIFEKDPSKTAAVTKSLETAHEQVIFLSRMVNDLSTLSRAERGVADEAEDIDVKAMAHDLYNEYSVQAEKKKLHFELEVGHNVTNVFASRLYLHELLQNFITNSIKYTKEGSVTLSIKKKGNCISFAVTDSGIGISKADQKRIFHKFYRSEDYRTRETGGTGLGLYVAAKLARKLDTTIDVKSRLNHGSTFSFMLPCIASEKKPKT